jgi:hypothetical protein
MRVREFETSQHLSANACIAALCAETQDRQSEILATLEKVLNVGKFPSKSILGDLVNVWGGSK